MMREIHYTKHLKITVFMCKVIFKGELKVYTEPNREKNPVSI